MAGIELAKRTSSRSEGDMSFTCLRQGYHIMRGGCVSKSPLLHVTNLFCSAGHESMRLEFESTGKVEVRECVPSQVVRCVSELMVNAEDPDPLNTWNVITTLRQLLEGEIHTHMHTHTHSQTLWRFSHEGREGETLHGGWWIRVSCCITVIIH